MTLALSPREWFSAGELAEMKLPGIPATDRGIAQMADRLGWAAEAAEGTAWRPRQGKGGGIEFHYSVLPRSAQVPIAAEIAKVNAAARAVAEAETTSDARQCARISEVTAWWARQPDSRKAKGVERMELLDQVTTLVRGGMTKTDAMNAVARQAKIAVTTLYAWENTVAGIEGCYWSMFLTPRHLGRTAKSECDPRAWDFIKVDYLRPEQPNFAACYRRLQKVAAAEGWQIPSEDTLKRRIDKLPVQLRVRERQGDDALKQLFPYQKRDRGVFHALQAVNADGHKWDVFVRWPDGHVDRPVMVVFQDLYSGKILSWRVDKSENREAVRLAFGDMIEAWGIPEECYLDNGRNFASKWLTGGIPNRYRFKVKDDDPVGIMTQMKVSVHWTTPYSGQSKPIERGFRDFAQDISKHPAFAGAWTGNTVADKPSNYDKKNAVTLDTFIKTVAGEIIEHNARKGRRSALAAGRSFDETFDASYKVARIRKANVEQRRLWLMAAESVRAARRDGAIELLGNRYWAEDLLEYRGQKIIVRFDPEQLHEPLHVYTLAGQYVASAECQLAAGFNNVEAAREHARKRNAFKRGWRMMAEAEKKYPIEQVAAMLPETTEPPAPETKIVRPMFGRSGAAASAAALQLSDEQEVDMLINAAMADAMAGRRQHIRLVEDPDGE
jgi:transposase InsO family protein